MKTKEMLLLTVVLVILLWSMYQLYKLFKSTDNFTTVRHKRRHPKKRHTKKKPVDKNIKQNLNENEDEQYEDEYDEEDDEDEQEDCGECEACPTAPPCDCNYEGTCKLLNNLEYDLNHGRHSDNPEVWSIANNGTLYKSDCSNNVCNWTNVPGILKTIDQNNRELWGLTSEGTIFKCEKPCTGNWVSVPGNLDNLSVGTNHLWGIKGKKLESDGKIKDGTTYTCVNTVDSPCTGNWSVVQTTNMDKGGIKQVSV
jgi:hypothetical protein